MASSVRILHCFHQSAIVCPAPATVKITAPVAPVGFHMAGSGQWSSLTQSLTLTHTQLFKLQRTAKMTGKYTAGSGVPTLRRKTLRRKTFRRTTLRRNDTSSKRYLFEI